VSLNVADGLDLLASPLVHERVTRIADHRPWPMPGRWWVMAQTWTDLLFAHWSVDPATLESLVPPQLPLDTFDGRAWIAVTPFGVRNTRPRPTLPVPFVSAFPEINVRTYVTVGDKPGIFFFSLDADSALAVATARRAYRLPYFRSRMSIDRNGRTVDFASERTSSEAPARAEFRARYGPTGAIFNASPDTLEHWLTERYCLYTLDDERRVLRGDIHHPPWPLQPADADIGLNTMAAELAIDLDDDPLLHYARRQDVVFWPLHAATDAHA
jgi:uncharacterized protein YqjF (DUF2071 family)